MSSHCLRPARLRLSGAICATPAPAASPTRLLRLGLLLPLMLLLAACAPYGPSFEPPSVRVVGVRPLESDTLAPRFEITLRVLNPNAKPLALRGLSYDLTLDDFDVVEGVASDLPEVPGYGEVDVRLAATVSVVEGLRFVTGILRESRVEDVTWRLRARLDVGGLLGPIRIEERGELRLNR